MKKRTTYVVFHTTENGADYKVFHAKTRPEAVIWEHQNRDKYPRPLIIRKVTF